MIFRLWWRHVVRQPATFAAAVLGLAVGLGAGSAVYAIVDVTLLRPIPGVRSGGLVAARNGEGRADNEWYSYADYQTLTTRTDLFDGVAAFGLLRPSQRIATNGIDTKPGITLLVSSNYFDVLGVRLAAGRAFVAADEQPTTAPAAVLGYAFWRSHFGSEDPVLGREIQVGDVRARVVGIAPRSFHGTQALLQPDIYLPLTAMTALNPVKFDWLGQQSPLWLYLVARLRAAVTLGAANAALGIASTDGAVPRMDRTRDIRVVDIRRAVIPPTLWEGFKTLVRLFAVASVCLWGVACLTVGTLLLVQVEQRRHDLGIRLALGATRSRLVVGCFLDALAPTVGGAMLSIPVALTILTTVDFFLARSGSLWAGSLDVHLNASFVLFTVVGTMLATCAVTAVASRGLFRAAATDPLREGPTLVTRHGSRRVLVFAEVMAAMVLLASAALVGRSLQAIYAVDLGYQPDRLIEATVNVVAARTTEAGRRELYETIDRELRAALPKAMIGQAWREWLSTVESLKDQPIVRAEESLARQQVFVRAVTPGYLAAMGIPLIGGELPRDSEWAGGGSALVSLKLSRLIEPAGKALGQRLGRGAAETRPAITGVVGDIRLTPMEPARPTAYVAIGTLPAYAPASQVQRSVAGNSQVRHVRDSHFGARDRKRRPNSSRKAMASGDRVSVAQHNANCRGGCLSASRLSGPWRS